MQTLKSAPAKTARVSKPKKQTLTAFVVAGVVARLGKHYYKSALAYHKRAKTAFPRERLEATRKALTLAEATLVFDRHDKEILPPADRHGQACFDIYMMSLKK